MQFCEAGVGGRPCRLIAGRLQAMIALEFLITSLIVVLIPGTGVIYTVSTGLTQGRRASVYAALGCTAGIVPHLLATVLGLAAVMHTSALAFQILKYAGVAYLFYVAYATWRDRSAFAVDGTLSRSHPWPPGSGGKAPAARMGCAPAPGRQHAPHPDRPGRAPSHRTW